MSSEDRRSRIARAPAPAGDVLRVLAGPALRPEPRSQLAPLVGHDFERIRIHADDAAARSAESLGARAYAIGRHLVFGRNEYAPNTGRGQALLAHELTHAAQQGLADPTPADVANARIDAAPADEREARATAAATAAGRPVAGVAGQSRLSFARDDTSSAAPKPVHLKPYERKVRLDDHDAGQTREITESSDEFKQHYVDRNIDHVEYWSTPYAATDPEMRNFWVIYTDGRRLQFNLGEIPIRERHIPPAGSGYRSVRLLMPAQRYYKRNGFIFPDVYGDKSTPRLVDIATTIEFNHRQREKFLEIATVTFEFAMILTAYVPGAETPNLETGGASSSRLPQRRFAAPEGEPVPEPRESPPPSQSRSKPVPEKGTAGDRAASAQALAAREPVAPAPLPASQQAIADTLRQEHLGLTPAVAADAARGGERAAGAGGAGADVILIGGGAREVTVHRGAFNLQNLGRHLLEEQAQAGTTEIYMQLNTGTREELLGLIPQLRRGYAELEGTFVKFFGPDGRAWWSGRFFAPP